MKQNKKNWFVLLLVCAVAICGIAAGVYQYRSQPCPLIENREDVTGIGIEYNSTYGRINSGEGIRSFLDVDDAAVLDCLSRYEKQNTWKKVHGYEERTMRLTLAVYYREGNPAQLVLGDENFYYDSRPWSYEILRGEQLQEELLEILGIQDKQ